VSPAGLELRQHHYEWSEKIWVAAEIWDFRFEPLNLAASNFDRLSWASGNRVPGGADAMSIC
jgi:hypothetical protein